MSWIGHSQWSLRMKHHNKEIDRWGETTTTTTTTTITTIAKEIIILLEMVTTLVLTLAQIIEGANQVEIISRESGLMIKGGHQYQYQHRHQQQSQEEEKDHL